MLKIEVDRERIRILTKRSLKLDVIEYRANHPEKDSAIISDILGSSWGDAYMPFYQMYGENGKVAGQEMGRLLSQVAKDLGLKSIKVNRFGKRDAITRYFF